MRTDSQWKPGRRGTMVVTAIVMLLALLPETPFAAATTAESSAGTEPFVDPTAQVSAHGVELGEHDYVGPFARLRATGPAKIIIGPESNAQDNVDVLAVVHRSWAQWRQIAAIGLHPGSGIVTGERVIIAHGSSVRGPAMLGVGAATPEDSGVFISFGAQVDGAILERDTGLSALSRVGPGIRLKSGLMVLPGKNVTRQREADDPGLGKVRPVVEADRLFNAGVVEVNVGLAREYNKLQDEDPTAVHGMNVDPGGNVFNPGRDAPMVDSAGCAGTEVRDPAFVNRIIGAVCFEDSLRQLQRRLGNEISLRADEGGPFSVGTIAAMDDGVIFHALEGADLTLGNRIRYGEDVIVHGGERPVDPATGLPRGETVIGNDVRLGNGAVVFRSLIRNGAAIGHRSAVVGSELAIGQRIPPRTIYLNNAVFGAVEW
ncbi:MAG: acetyltransferase [Nakamurella sp.]